MDQIRNTPPVLETAILEMGRMRGQTTFCPSEVVRWIYPQSWRYFLEDVQAEMMRLYKEDKLVVLQKNIPVDPHKIPKGPVRIRVHKTYQ